MGNYGNDEKLNKCVDMVSNLQKELTQERKQRAEELQQRTEERDQRIKIEKRLYDIESGALAKNSQIDPENRSQLNSRLESSTNDQYNQMNGQIADLQSKLNQEVSKRMTIEQQCQYLERNQKTLEEKITFQAQDTPQSLTGNHIHSKPLNEDQISNKFYKLNNRIDQIQNLVNKENNTTCVDNDELTTHRINCGVQDYTS